MCFCHLQRGGYEEQKKKLPGITFVYLGLRFVEGYPENVRKLGYILDNEEEAEEFANWYDGWINKIKSRTEELFEDEKPRVFFWSFYSPGGDYQTVDKTSRIHQICEIAGGEDVAEDLPFTSTWPKVDAEWVIEQNPDVIVALAPCKLSLYGYNVDDPSEMKVMWEEIMNRPELANVNAVKNGNVYMVSLRLWCKPSGGGCLVGIPYLAKWT
jgi:iron complex transport system substrate-binding protein